MTTLLFPPQFYILFSLINLFISFFLPKLKIQNEADDLEGREAALKTKESQQIQQELKAVKIEIEDIVHEFENQLRIANTDKYNLLLKKSESAIASIVEAHQPTDGLSIEDTGSSFYVPQPGEQVNVKGLGNKLATVIEVPDDDDMVLVQYGRVRVRVNKHSIRALANGDVSGGSASKQVLGVTSISFIIGDCFIAY